jgi:hypothetical protein
MAMATKERMKKARGLLPGYLGTTVELVSVCSWTSEDRRDRFQENDKV